MFSDDLQDLRKVFLKVMHEQIQKSDEREDYFKRERDFFLNSASDSSTKLNGLEEIIEQLKQ